MSSIHALPPHPVPLHSQPLSTTHHLPDPYEQAAQSYHHPAQHVDYMPHQVSMLIAYQPPPHYPGNMPYPEQGAQLNAPTSAQFPARDMRYYVDGGTQYQPPQGFGHPPPQDHSNTPNYDPPSGRDTKVPGILALMPVNILMTMMVNGSRRITMEHHIKIAIPHIVPHTKLISCSPVTVSSPNILEKSLGRHMRSSLTSWPTSIIGMRQRSL